MSESSSRKRSKGKATIGVAFLLGITALVFVPELMSSREHDRIMDTGERGTATILSLKDTGNRSNTNPEVRFTLEVIPKDGKPYRSSTTSYISPVDLMSYRVGTTIDVMYDPADPTVVMMIPGSAKPPPDN